MAWDEEMIGLVRAMIDDTDEDNPNYSDDRLEQAIIVAARLVIQDCDFPYPFRASITSGEITPDPTDDDTKDDNFTNLVSVRAACIIDRGAAMKAAGQAIRIKDGTSEIDLKAVFGARMDLIKKGWCAVYDEMKLEYQSTQAGEVFGAAIVGPFRLFANEYYPRSPRNGF